MLTIKSSRWLTRASVFGALIVFAAGCGNEGESRPAGVLNLGGETGFGGDLIVSGGCSEDEGPKECKVYHHQANGVTSCFTGVQFCEDGRWTDCLAADTAPSSSE